MAVVISKQIQLPALAVALSDIEEGSIVNIREGGAAVPFFVAKHNYESALNGTGRTLLVRKDIYTQRVWSNSYIDTDSGAFGTVTYDGSVSTGCILDTYLNKTYLTALDAKVQSAIATTKFYFSSVYWKHTNQYNQYTGYNYSGTPTVKTMDRGVFMLSATELGLSGSLANVEGTTLPTARILAVAQYNGAAAMQWLRSPSLNGPTSACCATSAGTLSSQVSGGNGGVRPCFTLPETARFSPDTLEFVGVA